MRRKLAAAEALEASTGPPLIGDGEVQVGVGRGVQRVRR